MYKHMYVYNILVYQVLNDTNGKVNGRWNLKTTIYTHVTKMYSGAGGSCPAIWQHRGGASLAQKAEALCSPSTAPPLMRVN